VPAHEAGSGDLERTLGLPATLAIGVGTMVGAGIFLFPGIAGGKAGPLAVVAFAAGGLVALLVAVVTAELATAMPRSGGAYAFVSRTLGPFAGALVGAAQAIGLVFASSFYLVGFGRYAGDLARRFGLTLDLGSFLVPVLTAVLLTGLNVRGARKAGNLQSAAVLALTAGLAILIGYGLLDVTGLIGETRWPADPAPRGYAPLLPTTALVFTSYLGFAQIATVGGEVKDPGHTLPRALIGSVLIAIGIYVATMLVTTSLLSAGQLESLGGLALGEVARRLVGEPGALGVLVAGLLATLSSANASILGSSRSVFALSKDELAPQVLGRVGKQYGTPYAAVIAVGVPIACLAFVSELELLAEVASLLHLVIYSLICASLVLLRRRRPQWYRPTFRAPGGALIALLGGAACLGLVAFLSPTSLVVGASILALAAVVYAAGLRARAE